MRASLKLGRIAGIEVGVHYTWFFAFFLITWSLASGSLLAAVPRPGAPRHTGSPLLPRPCCSSPPCWCMSSPTPSLARARGLPAHSITLFIFGGVSNLGAEAERPRDEFVVAVVGPLASLMVARRLVAPSVVCGQPGPARGRHLQLPGHHQRHVGRFQSAAGVPPGWRPSAAFPAVGQDQELFACDPHRRQGGPGLRLVAHWPGPAARPLRKPPERRLDGPHRLVPQQRRGRQPPGAHQPREVPGRPGRPGHGPPPL